MGQMPHSDHYIHFHRPKFLKKNMTTLDKLVLAVSIAYPLSALPQAYQVYQGNVEGVSIYSWLSFLVCASLFFVYGMKHKVFPMIVSNFLWIAMDGLVVLGILAYKIT